MSRALVVGNGGAAGGLLVVPVAVCVGGKLVVLLTNAAIWFFASVLMPPPARMSPSLLISAFASTVVVVTAVTAVPLVVETVFAVQYGALQAPEGRLSVTWETWLGAQGRQRLALLWRESGVRMPPHASIRRGQGRELIENALRFSLHADTQLVFSDDGVWCRIELPVDRRSAERLDPAQIEAGT